MKVYLIGYMYSGKSSLGKKLASRAGLPFLDTDLMFEKKHSLSISSFIHLYGEEKFRIAERDCLHSTEEIPAAIIATGGGTPCFFDNMAWIKKHGKSIYLEASAEEIMSRAQKSKQERPLLKTYTSTEEKKEFIKKHLGEREKFYVKADWRCSAFRSSIDELLDKIKEFSLAN